MSSFIVAPSQDGKRIIGHSAEDHALFESFKRNVLKGKVTRVETKRVRCPRHHRAYMGMLREVFKHNSLFQEETAMRHWIEMEAGHFMSGIDKDGVVHKVHKSISYDALEEDKFIELHKRVAATIMTESVAALLFYESTDPVSTAEALLTSRQS